MESTFRILFVCTANLCRSPMAEFLLRAALERNGRHLEPETWTVGSAGVDAYDDLPMHPLALQTLAERRIDGSAFRSRQVTPEILAEADIVLTATREHRALVARVAPLAARKSFTVLQFARLAGRVPAERDPATADRGQRLLAGVLSARSGVQPVSAEADSIADPVGRPIAVFRSCATELDRAVEQILAPLVPPTRRLRRLTASARFSRRS